MSERRTDPLDAEEANALAALGLAREAYDARAGCPDPALLIAVGEGVLDDELAMRVRAHAETCPICQQVAGDLAAALDDAPAAESHARIDALVTAGRTKRSPSLWYWLVPATGLAAAAGVAWAVVASRVDVPPVPQTQIARVSPLPTPTIFTVDRPDIPVGDVDLTVRGDGSTRPSLLNQIAAALDRADAGEVSRALGELEAVAAANPEARSAALALGAVQLHAGRNAEAMGSLERAKRLTGDPAGPDNPLLKDEIDWFLSLAYVRTGQPDRARPLVQSLCVKGAARSVRACAGLQEIDRPPAGR